MNPIINTIEALDVIQATIERRKATLSAAQTSLFEAETRAQEIEEAGDQTWHITDSWASEQWPIKLTPITEATIRTRPGGVNTLWREVQIMVGSKPFYIVGKEKRHLYSWGFKEEDQKPVLALYRDENGKIVVVFDPTSSYNVHVYEEVPA